MNQRDTRMYSEFRPSSKITQEFLDIFKPDIEKLLKVQFSHLIGLKFKTKNDKGVHFIIRAFGDRNQEIEVHLLKSSFEQRSPISLVKASEITGIFEKSVI